MTETTTARPRNIPEPPRRGAATRAGAAPRRGGRNYRLRPRARKAVLTCHVTVAVGWVGVEIAQVLIGIVGLSTGNAELLRATRLVMELLGIELVVGLAWSSLLTGLLLALATPWGLVKHYWVAAKLVMTIALMLTGHFFFRHWLQHQVATPTESIGVRIAVGFSISLVLLVTATALSIYKPWGRTRFFKSGSLS